MPLPCVSDLSTDLKTLRKKTLELKQREAFLLHRCLIRANHAILVILEGHDEFGIVEILDSFSEALDPRFFNSFYFFEPTKLEKKMPRLHRFQINTPAFGNLHFFHGSWYTDILEKSLSKKKQKAFLEQASMLERILHNNSISIVKLNITASKSRLKKRFDKKTKKSHSQIIAQVAQRRIDKYKRYERSMKKIHMVTNFTRHPWVRIDTSNLLGAKIKAFDVLIGQLEKHASATDLRVIRK